MAWGNHGLLKYGHEETWDGMNKLLKSRSSANHIYELNHNGTSIKDSTKVANTFFVNVDPYIANEIPKSPKSPLSFMGQRVQSNFNTNPTDNREFMIHLL